MAATKVGVKLRVFIVNVSDGTQSVSVNLSPRDTKANITPLFAKHFPAFAAFKKNKNKNNEKLSLGLALCPAACANKSPNNIEVSNMRPVFHDEDDTISTQNVVTGDELWLVPRIKVVAVGDDIVSKAELLITYITEHSSTEYDPTDDKAYFRVVQVEGYLYVIQLCDTGGTANFEAMRQLLYRNMDVLMLFYDVCNNETLANIKGKWYPEVLHYRPDAIIAMVGVKQKPDDSDPSKKPATIEEAQHIAAEIKALKVVVCDMLTDGAVKAAFQEVFQVTFKVLIDGSNVESKQSNCVIS